MKILTLLNEKGGVGKTTMATHIAAGLALRGKRVILVDADPQGHATVAFGLSKEPMFHDLVVRDLPFPKAVRRIAPSYYGREGAKIEGELLVIPSDVSTRAIALANLDVTIIHDRFREMENVIDFVVFDTAPTPSPLHNYIYMAADAVIYPTKCEYLSFDGLMESLRRKDDISRARQRYGLDELKVGGIIPTMYRAGTQADDYGLELLGERFGELVWTPIKLRTVWNQASFAQRVLFNFAPETKAAGEAWESVKRAEAI